MDIVGGAVTLGAAVALLAALVAVTLTQPLALDSRIFGVGVFTALPCLTSVGACLHQALRGGDS